MLISIVIPFHNEEQSLPQLISELRSAIDEMPQHEFEVLLVNDCSTDSSAQIASSHCTKKPFRFVSLATRSGQTGAFKAAFDLVNGDYTIRMDADLQDNPADLRHLVGKIEQNYDLVLGDRTNRQHSFGLKILTGIYDSITSRMFKTDLRSNSGSFIAFRTKFIREIPFVKNDHRYLPLICMRRGALRRTSVKISHRPRMYGCSKYTILKKALLGFPEVARFYLRYIKGHYDLSQIAHSQAAQPISARVENRQRSHSTLTGELQDMS